MFLSSLSSAYPLTQKAVFWNNKTTEALTRLVFVVGRLFWGGKKKSVQVGIHLKINIFIFNFKRVYLNSLR